MNRAIRQCSGREMVKVSFDRSEFARAPLFGSSSIKVSHYAFLTRLTAVLEDKSLHGIKYIVFNASMKTRNTAKSLSSHRPSSRLKFTEIHLLTTLQKTSCCQNLGHMAREKAFSWEIRGVAERCLQFLPHSGRFSELDSGKSRIRKIRRIKPSISSGFSSFKS